MIANRSAVTEKPRNVSYYLEASLCKITELFPVLSKYVWLYYSAH